METITKETISRRILDRLNDGRGRSSNGRLCFYRHDGNRCAIGCLIDDANYDPRMELSSLTRVEIRSGEWTAKTSASREEFLVKALTQQGIPATEEMLSHLNMWQRRHDIVSNWKRDGDTFLYVGPTDDDPENI